MSEIRGLQNIIDSATLHGITAPPDPEDFPDHESYVKAYDEWWAKTNCWHSTRREL